MASALSHYFSPVPIKGKSQKGCSCSRKHLPLQIKSLEGPGEQDKSFGSHNSLRRSANYHPSIWDHRLIESTQSPFMDKCVNMRIDELKSKIKLLLKTCKEPLDCLHLIDSIQRLGMAYHFGEEIKDALDCLDGNCCSSDLHEASLSFRILRQHAYRISSDLFNRFIDDGVLKICFHHDARGLLSLYEASYLSFHGETTLEKAMETTAIHLKSLAGCMDIKVAEQVRHSLGIPLYWRIPRLEAIHYMHLYATEEGSNSCLLELAKLDFNVVQSIHQEELRELSRWWKDLGIGEELTFSRDRLVENYFWAAGITFEPQFSNCRKKLTQMICILTVIDDMYDIHGSPEELQLFTAAVESWNLELLESLPDYMKLCYLALYNSANEVAYGFLKDNRQDITPLIRKEWKCLCKAYLTEAEWFNKGYTPSLKEYLENAWISVGGPIAMAYAYFLGAFMTTNEASYCSEQGLKLIYLSSLITRISNDMGTSKAEMQRGDAPKSIECYMYETGESEENSRTHIKGLVRNLWEELNEECITTPLPRSFVNMVLNMARTAQSLFQHGDGIGTSTGITKDQITSLFFQHVK